MKRAVGFLVFLVLIGGSVWGGLASEPQAPKMIRDVHDLGRLLSSLGFACNQVETNLPGFQPSEVKEVGICDMPRSHVTLYVFHSHGAARGYVRHYREGTNVGWVVGPRWMVVVHGHDLAKEIANSVGGTAVVDDLFVELGRRDGLGLRCPEGDLVQQVDGEVGGAGRRGRPEAVASEVLNGIEPDDEFQRVGRSVAVQRDGSFVAMADFVRGEPAGWLLESVTACASSRVGV